jgi:hypothetical protein
MKAAIKYGDQEFRTFCEIQGVEHAVCVHYDTSPAEPDVGWAGGLDINGVYLEDQGCQISNMTDEEYEQLEMRVNEHENDRTDPYNDPRY